MRAILPAIGILTVAGLSTATAEIQSGELRIKSVKGMVTCSTDQSKWVDARPDLVLQRGASLRTGSESSANLVFEYSGTVLRMTPNSEIELARLDKEVAGESTIIQTSLRLKSGRIIGSQHKLAKPSKFEIATRGAVATIRGTEYAVHANGAVTCFTGAVAVGHDSPKGGGRVQDQVPAGCSYSPDSGRVSETGSDYLKDSRPDIDDVRKCVDSNRGAGCWPIEEPRCPISPYNPPPHHGPGDDDHGGHGDDHGGHGDDHGGHGDDHGGHAPGH
jgi:hypothetical protein